MSISNLFTPNDYTIYAKQFLNNNGQPIATNQLFWNSYVQMTPGDFIGPVSELSTYAETYAVTGQKITFTQLAVSCSVPPGSPGGGGGDWFFTLYVNGIASSLTAEIIGLNTFAISFVNSISLNPGDTFAVHISASGSPNNANGSLSLTYF